MFNHRMPNRSPFVLATLALAVAGCSGNPAPTQTQPRAGTPTQVQGQAPAAPGPAAPQAPTAPQPASGRIQLLDVKPGKPASFVTQPGSALTVIASAASYTTSPSTFRLSVNEPASAAATAYHAASYHTAEAEGAADWPTRSGFGASTRDLLQGARAGRVGARHLQSASGPAPARALGSTDSFWVNSGDSTTAGDYQQTCVLARSSEHAYFYVDQQAKPISDAQLDSLVSQFEQQIYPRETPVFGEPANLPNLADNKLAIVISPAVDDFGRQKGLMGYFWSRDVLPNQAASQHSNQRKIVFMTDKLFDYAQLTSFGTLAHEFQHLINFSHKAVNTNFNASEDTWLDEGLAMYAMEVAGYGLPAGDKLIAKDLNGFEQSPALYSLTDWASNPHGFAYGQSYLFVRYLADRFGPGVIKQLVDAKTAGQDSVNAVLAGQGEDFASFFRAWTITNLINGTPLADGTPYHYNQLDLAANYGGLQLHGFQTTPASSPDLTADLKPWGSAYYTFSSNQPQAWQFNLGNNGASRLLGAALLP